MRALFVELLGGFGDLLLALPSVHALARSGWAVDVLTFAPGDALLRGDPHVQAVLSTCDHTPGAPRAAVARALSRGYDLAVTTTTYDGIAELCRAAAPRAVVDLWQDPPAHERVDRRFLRLLEQAGVVRPELVDLPLQVHVGQPAAPVLAAGDSGPVVLVPGAGMAVKVWPYWQQLVEQLAAPVFATEPLAGAQALPAGDLTQLAALFRQVGRSGGVVVGGDTGPVRLAAAVGTPCVGLYGPTLAARYGLGPPHADLQGLPGCDVRRPTSITEQECWWSGRCPLTEGAPGCLSDLPVEQVLAAVTARRRAGAGDPALDGAAPAGDSAPRVGRAGAG